MPDYDVVKIDPGERRVIRVDSGETFENKLIDMTARGAGALVYAHGTNWTIRNVGFKGAISGDIRALTCSDQGGNTSTVENVYMGDGTVEDSAPHRFDPSFGIWVNPNHSGHIDFKNVFVEGALDNAFYCSAPGYTGAGGTVHIDRCYSKNNHISCYRIGAEGDKVTNSVAVGGHRTHRGIWGWDPGPHEIVNCDLAMKGDGQAVVAGANDKATTMNLKNTQYDATAGLNARYGSTINTDSDCGTDPEDYVPEGTPTSAEEAASGSTSGDGGKPIPSGPTFEHEISFEGEGDYYFEVETGPIGVESAETGDDGDVYGHEAGTTRHAAGKLEGGKHTFGYDSYLADIIADDGVEVRINGEHEPTWGLYPTGESEGRDWLNNVPWYDPEDDTGGSDPSDPDDGHDEEKCEDLLDEISALEDENTMLRDKNAQLESKIDEYRGLIEEVEAGLDQTDSLTASLRKRIAALRE